MSGSQRGLPWDDLAVGWCDHGFTAVVDSSAAARLGVFPLMRVLACCVS
ncbi:hypothetical protein [Streptomyces sp. CA-106110]